METSEKCIKQPWPLPRRNEHIPAGERENHLQISIGRGYVSSLEDIFYDITRVYCVFDGTWS